MGAEAKAAPKETGTSALELLRSFSDPLASGAAAEGPAAAKCRPLDLGDFLRRLRSFRTHWWFNKPLGASPIECARHGWVNVGPDTLECECCGEELRIWREGETWLANGKPVENSAAAWAEVLSHGHGPFCPWRSHEVGVGDPSKLSDHELAEAAEERLRGLRSRLSFRPVLDAGSRKAGEGEEKAEDALESLARAGWAFGGLGPSGAEMLQCAFCLRAVAVQSFAHLPVSSTTGNAGAQRGESGEPAAKAPRLEAAAGSDMEPRPPAPGLWTPGLWTPAPPQIGAGRPGAPAPAAAAAPALATMDPYALHRFYCPLYARADDDLGPAAVRLIRAHVDAARSAAGISAADGEGAGAESSAVARAEELLRTLDAILPPA